MTNTISIKNELTIPQLYNLKETAYYTNTDRWYFYQGQEQSCKYTKVESSINQSLTNKLPNYKFYPLINDVYQYIPTNNPHTSILTSVSEEINTVLFDEKNAHFPLFCLNINVIKIPSKVYVTLKRYTPKRLLKKIHQNIEVAIELCLLFITQLNSTYFDYLMDSANGRWKPLMAKYLREYLNTSSLTYKYIREALNHPLKNGAIVECDYQDIRGEKCYYYRLGEAYFGKGLVKYILTTKEAQKIYNNHLFTSYSRSVSNPICRNLIEFYSTITLPTKDEIIAEAKKLVNKGHVTKKGKKLTFLNKHIPSYFKNPEDRSYVEHSIEIFEYLTGNGLMIPEEGSESSGGRVVDSFTLMPSWIRNLVKVDGQSFAECDYSCLHPNIAMSIYGGSKEFIQHKDIASDLGIDVSTVKLEHLSFFNKQVWQMKQSPLYTYYMKEDPMMINKIIQEKYNSPFKHKATSRNLFKKEVEIMTEVINQLNHEGIFVGYVYDALFCNASYAPKVKHVMDATINNLGVKTTAKIVFINQDATQEQWKTINGFENLYEINLAGVVKNINQYSTSKLTTRIDRAGYTTVRLSKNGNTHTKYIHRLIAESFITNPNNKPEVNHKDGNKLNNAVDNLEWVTHAENMKHAYYNNLIKHVGFKVIDSCSGKSYKSIKDAAIDLNINYGTCRNYLNGNIAHNKTCLKYVA